VLRRIDWSTPANVLEKIIRYEAVHAIRDWDDLRRRIDPPDHRCYAFFHPALIDEPLIFVEIALTREIPAAIGTILESQRQLVEPDKATTATFYSISNCQRGLAGVSFGSFLIKQVIEEIRRENPRLSTFVTLSPAPNFAEWLRRERLSQASVALRPEDKAALAPLDREDWWQIPAMVEKVREPLLRAAAWYYLHARTNRGTPRDSVARFHLGNGARFPRRHLDESASPIARADGELSLRPRRHREESRDLCGAAPRRRLQRGHQARPFGAAGTGFRQRLKLLSVASTRQRFNSTMRSSTRARSHSRQRQSQANRP
jgi:malonyl-CoA decarboxylase